ncbi:MAG: 4Fe-4S binding protein [Candidatus Latescibacteria bacterium]|nr:4Fe-4S binding protein [Candidatus Latescibacterota bacterium]
MEVDRRLCDVCGTCVAVCSSDAITIRGNKLVIDHELCVNCLACVSVCPVGALGEGK